MKLTELEPTFVRLWQKGWEEVATLQEAQGVEFLCPKCFVTNKGSAGTHGVVCWFRNHGVPDDMVPGPGRWDVKGGTTLEDLTLQPSILLQSNPDPKTGEERCAWHGFITAGAVITA